MGIIKECMALWNRDSSEAAEVRSGWELRKRVALENGHTKVQLWKDGPYWAETNIGASTPWGSGHYFWWGDTVGYAHIGNAFVPSVGYFYGSPPEFSFNEANVPTCGKSIDKLKCEGWITDNDVLAPEHDAAYVQWGGDWRMPTHQELQDLVEKCDWTRATMNGVEGYVVRGRGYHVSACIFLPSVGFARETSLWDIDDPNGSYWSSVPESDDDSNGNFAWFLDFKARTYDCCGFRYNGVPIRPVQGFTK